MYLGIMKIVPKNKGLQDRVLLIVVDGLGFNLSKQNDIIAEVIINLNNTQKSTLRSIQKTVYDTVHLDKIPSLLHPIHAEGIPIGADMQAALYQCSIVAQAQQSLLDCGLSTVIDNLRRSISIKRKYVPWATHTPFIVSFRNKHFTVPTLASGEWVGFDNSDPPFQGNSETGHQNIGSLTMVPQISRIISKSVKEGTFFTNKALNATIQSALSNNKKVVFCFMISGTTGIDGGVHSCWLHLEAFLELLFTRIKVPTSRVVMQAVLDGRDSGAKSSLQIQKGIGGYLYKLKSLLKKYNALDCLGWVIGRGIAMDRDYREYLAKADWSLLTKVEGIKVEGFNGLVETVSQLHEQGSSDQNIPPIAVADSSGSFKRLADGDAFLNLNFRSDRQRIKAATLTGAKEFLLEQSAKRGRHWQLNWIAKDFKIHYCAIASCHPVLDSMHNFNVAFATKPVPTSIATLWAKAMPESHKYVLVSESVKSSHMGYFFRGLRATPENKESEIRKIVPSITSEQISSDWDFHKFPAMQMHKVAEHVLYYLESPSNRLVCCNLASSDMVGHLLPNQFEAAVSALEETDKAVKAMVTRALQKGWIVVLTSDHGNIEEDTPSHSCNPVLTTIADSKGALVAGDYTKFVARLFDVGYTVASLLGMEEQAKLLMEANEFPYGYKFAGRSIVKVKS